MKKIIRAAYFLASGLNKIHLNQKRNYRRKIRGSKILNIGERWNILGNRLKKSAEKVVEQTG